jgi:hypothetical protein
MEWVDNSCWKGKQGGGLHSYIVVPEIRVSALSSMYVSLEKEAVVSVNGNPWLEQISIDIIKGISIWTIENYFPNNKRLLPEQCCSANHHLLLSCTIMIERFNFIVTWWLGLSPPRVVTICIINGAMDTLILSWGRTGKDVTASSTKYTDTGLLNVQAESSLLLFGE